MEICTISVIAKNFEYSCLTLSPVDYFIGLENCNMHQSTYSVYVIMYSYTRSSEFFI